MYQVQPGADPGFLGSWSIYNLESSLFPKKRIQNYGYKMKYGAFVKMKGPEV